MTNSNIAVIHPDLFEIETRSEGDFVQLQPKKTEHVPAVLLKAKQQTLFFSSWLLVSLLAMLLPPEPLTAKPHHSTRKGLATNHPTTMSGLVP